MGSGDSDSVIRAVSVDEEDECVLPCTFSPGAYVEVVGHVVFGDGYEGQFPCFSEDAEDVRIPQAGHRRVAPQRTAVWVRSAGLGSHNPTAANCC